MTTVVTKSNGNLAITVVTKSNGNLEIKSVNTGAVGRWCYAPQVPDRCFCDGRLKATGFAEANGGLRYGYCDVCVSQMYWRVTYWTVADTTEIVDVFADAVDALQRLNELALAETEFYFIKVESPGVE